MFCSFEFSRSVFREIISTSCSSKCLFLSLNCLATVVVSFDSLKLWSLFSYTYIFYLRLSIFFKEKTSFLLRLNSLSNLSSSEFITLSDIMEVVSWSHSSSNRLQVSSLDTLNVSKAIIPIRLLDEWTSCLTMFLSLFSPSWMAYKLSHTYFAES